MTSRETPTLQETGPQQREELTGCAHVATPPNDLRLSSLELN